MPNADEIRILEIGYKQIASELLHAEDMEHKCAITVSTMMIFLAGFVAQSNTDINTVARGGLIAFFIVFVSLADYFIYMNMRRKFLLFKDLLRIEEIFGFFDRGVFFQPEFLDKREPTAHPEPTVFVKDGLDSGNKEPTQSAFVHGVAIVLIGFAAAVVVAWH